MTSPQWQPQPWYPPAPVEPHLDQCNHVLHLLLTLITFGLWAPIWLLIGVTTQSANRRRLAEWREKRRGYDQFMWENYGPRP